MDRMLERLGYWLLIAYLLSSPDQRDKVRQTVRNGVEFARRRYDRPVKKAQAAGF